MSYRLPGFAELVARKNGADSPWCAWREDYRKRIQRCHYPGHAIPWQKIEPLVGSVVQASVGGRVVTGLLLYVARDKRSVARVGLSDGSIVCGKVQWIEVCA